MPYTHRIVELLTPRRVLLITHDLNRSGAPRVVYELAKFFRTIGAEVTVLSPSDGAFRQSLTELGSKVVLDHSALNTDSVITKSLAKGQDLVICNTVVSHGAATNVFSTVPTYWYIHEISLLADLLAREPAITATLRSVAGVWSGSELSAGLIRSTRTDVRVLPYGLPQIASSAGCPPGGHSGLIRVNIFGSIERRKGQDVAIAALGRLGKSLCSKLVLTMYGRVLEPDYCANVRDVMRALPHASLIGELDEESYRQAMVTSDIVLVPSRDDTLPLVSLDALGAGRILICTPTTGVSSYLHHGLDGFVSTSSQAESLASMLALVIEERTRWNEIGRRAQSLFSRMFSEDSFGMRISEALRFRLPDDGPR